MTKLNKTASLAAALLLATSASALAADTKIGILLGFTGPLDTLSPPMAESANLAAKNINDQGGLLGGNVVTQTGDDNCVTADMATAAATQLINDGAVAIVGAMCSGVTIAAANNVAIPNGVLMISPSGTAATITTLEDKDLVFRTSPSDAYNSEVFAKALVARGVKELGITYVNNDYGKGLSDNFAAAYTAAGGTITANVAHEEGKAEYRAELGQIAATGTQNLLVLAYANGSGKTVLQQAIESGDFSAYFGADGMVDNVLLEGFPAGALDGMTAMRPSEPTGAGPDAFAAAAAAGGMTTGSTFQQQSYDALFLIALALEKNGGAKEGLSQALRDVANAPGEVILPGEWSKAVELIKAGTDIDYQGASGPIEFDAAGDVAGSVVEMTVKDGAFAEVGPLS
ncbi:MAG: ABC transporter substrate-binding protein [Devosia sp.]|uniref:ABC transporter substrate-binding protein n=1 Tax=Devosia sp. 66-22 TaxID=1895753 RepID=UPI00092AE972|nr:ABC transporter substrate-binding protein [Devosia sp. 66-22]MBN9346912.1 ABC transporter substrate-binding protein [Devosia sp.]MCW5704995.1 ABC transporter substrate-binding protein [Bradyrhizobium sp.]OJX48652.1 MAG: amino acid ABC transporter substrate-binding protein [Devosia sp. 66-22]